MKRIALITATVAVAAFPSIASAKVAHGAATSRASSSTTTWTATYNASSYYGAVSCTGKTVVNKKYPGGKEIEVCTSTEGGLKHMKAGKEQHAFENSEGGFVNEWESDHTGTHTTEYSYSVNRKLTKFKLVAIY